MQKKVEDIIDAFENYRFEDSLRQIDQLMKKVSKDTKKKGALSDNDNRMVQIIKCGCLASIGKIHEANHILESFFTEKILAEIPDKEKFLFCSICQLAYDEKIMGKIEVLNKTGKGDVRLERFMLSHRLFSQVAKTFLREFVTQKKQEDGLAQIFLEYLNELNKLQPLQNYFAKDMTISHHKQLNLKMVQLFLMKYLSGINFSKLSSQKLKQSIIDLRLRLAINSCKIQQAKKIYLQFSRQMKDNFVYLRSIRDVAGSENEVEGNRKFYIEQCGVMFRRNLEIEQYVPMYDYYDEFLQFVLSEQVTKQVKGFGGIFGQQSLPQIKNQQLYDFKEITNQKVVLHYYQSLVTELKLLTEGELGQKAKKSDYYKISIKGLLLQILKIHSQLAHKITGSEQKATSLLTQSTTFNKYLQTYHNQFAKTLTFVNEMKPYLRFLKPKFQAMLSYVTFQKDSIKLPNVFGRQDDDLILLINGVKLLVVENAEKLHQWAQASYWVSLCWQFYEKFINQVEQMKRRQKGEVFLSDQFIIILSDIVSFHIENSQKLEQPQTQQLIESLLLSLSCILQQATQTSPYNGNLKLRLLYVCQKLNYFDKLVDTFLSLDIKSVQFQTLGYFIINPMNSFNLYSQLEQHLTRMVRSYQENHRQTSQYCLKGLKAGTTLQVLEYFSYQKRLTNSFSKMQLLYTLFNKYHNKEHAQFYLDWVDRQLTSIYKQSKQVSFNCDAKTTINNIVLLSQKQIYSQTTIDPYNEFYGHLNSPQVLMFEVQLKKLETLLKSASENKTNYSEKLLEAKLIQVGAFFSLLDKQSNFNKLLDIKQNFSLTDDYLTKKSTKKEINQQKETFTLNKIKKELDFYLKLAQIKLSLFYSAKNIIELLRQSENNEALINSTKEKFTSVFKNIEDVIIFFNNKLLWREQVKNCWALRETLFTINHLSKHLNEEAGKLKKLPKPIKAVITEFSNNLQKAVLANVTQLKFTESIKSDCTLLSVGVDEMYMKKISERDEMLRRTCTMDLKEAKNYLVA